MNRRGTTCYPTIRLEALTLNQRVQGFDAAFRAERHFHCIVENVDAAQHLIARIDREFDFFGSHRDFSLKLLVICGAIAIVTTTNEFCWLRGLLLGDRLIDYAHDVGLLHNKELLSVDLDLSARPFAEKHAVADFEVNRNDFPSLVATSWADGDHLSLRRLLFGGIWNNDSACGLILGVDARNHNAVVKR